MEEECGKKTRTDPQMFAALTGTILLAAFGFHIGWASPSLPILLEDNTVPVTLSQSTWIVSLMIFGSFSGPLISVAVVDRWGRKASMLLTSIPFLLSCILIAFAQNYWWYYMGRLICGMAGGAIFVIVPMYLGEIAEDRIRGSLSMLMNVMINIGLLLPYCVGPWVSRAVLAVLGALIPILHVSTFAWMPDTPHYYIMTDQPERARQSLEWLRGTKNISEEMKRVKETVEFDLKNLGTLRELFTDKGNRKALLIVIGLLTAQQISGNTAILAYTTIIFNEVTSGMSSSLSVIIIGVVQLIASILAVFLSYKAGRRTLLMISMFFSILFLIGEAVYFHLKAVGNDVSGISWLPVTSIVGYMCSYTVGLGVLPMTVISEIFSCNVKAYATTISTLYLAMAAMVVSQFYPIISNAYGVHVAFYGFAFGTTILMVFTFFYVPETKGKSFLEIQDILHGRTESNPKLEASPKIDCGKINPLSFVVMINVPKHGVNIFKQ